jgi:hypothetical protein
MYSSNSIKHLEHPHITGQIVLTGKEYFGCFVGRWSRTLRRMPTRLADQKPKMMPTGDVLMNGLRSQRRIEFKECPTESSAMREQALPDEVAAKEQSALRNAALIAGLNSHSLGG